MATYWKSQPKKYCKFCNCWITDNKASVDFHEKGKNHQENVKRKIDDVRKKSSEQAKLKAEAENDMRQMEEAAMEAFKKDLKDNPELAAKYGVKIKTDAEKQAEEETKMKKEEALKIKLATCKWFEARSPEDYSYYWNVETNESIWVAPIEYISIEEQKAQEEKAKEEEESTVTQEPDLEDSSPFESNPGVTVGPLPRVPQSAYGAWETVTEEEEETPADFLDLPTEAPPLPPEPDIIPLPPPPIEPDSIENIPLPPPPEEVKPPTPKEEKKTEEKPSKFKEKRVTSLGKDTNVTFKKRKIASGARNVRQRDDD